MNILRIKIEQIKNAELLQSSDNILKYFLHARHKGGILLNAYAENSMEKY